MNIFRVLMASRGVFLRLRLEHVAVLNTIPVEFADNDAVLKAWRNYLFLLNSTESSEELWRTRNDAFFELLYQISGVVGYKLDKDHLEKSSYEPSGYGDEAGDWMTIRKELLSIVRDGKAIPVELRPEAGAASAEAGK